jgi:hypothetical protein
MFQIDSIVLEYLNHGICLKEFLKLLLELDLLLSLVFILDKRLFCFAFDCFSKLYIPNSYLLFLLLKSCLLVGKPLHELFMVAAYPFNLLLGRRLAACTRVLAWNRSLLLSFLLFLLGSLCLVNYSLDTPAYGLLLFLFCKPFKSRLFFLLSFKLRIFFGLLFF